MRLQKFIAECGCASRRKAEEMILKGRIRVNGRPAVIGMNVISGKDKVTVDDIELAMPRGKVYIALKQTARICYHFKRRNGTKMRHRAY